MKTFGQYLKEASALTVGKDVFGTASLSDETEEGMGEIFRAVRIAMKRHRPQLMAFLKRLSMSDPDVQSALADMNMQSLNKMGSQATRGMKFGSDVVEPPAADTATGDTV